MPSRPAKQPTKRAEQKKATRERIAEMRREEERRDRRRRRLTFAGTGVALALIVAATVWGVSQERSDTPAPIALPTVAADGRTSAPPWSLPADTADRAAAVGLRVGAMEGTAKHFHTHLDVLVNGEPIGVPANIGIDVTSGAMSELHTHDERGVVHVEAPTDDKRYTLGQLFTAWDVRLDENGIGGLETDTTNSLRAYVDGERVEGNPADIELTARGQIALVYGPADADVDVPDSYDFEPGE